MAKSREMIAFSGDDIYTSLEKLMRGENTGRFFDFNSNRYRHLERDESPFSHPEGGRYLQLSFLNENGRNAPQEWSLRSVSSRIQLVLDYAAKKKISFSLSYPVNPDAPLLSYRVANDEETGEQTLYIRATREAKYSDSNPNPNQIFDLILPPNPTIAQESFAVLDYLSRLQQTIREAYLNGLWPKIDPNEIRLFNMGETFHTMHIELRRSRERSDFFNAFPREKAIEPSQPLPTQHPPKKTR